MAFFPSLFPQTFPAAPLLPNRFFHRDRTCVFCVRGGQDPISRKFPADPLRTASSTSAFSNRSYLDLATENAFCNYSRFVRLLSMHRNYNPVASMERIVFFLRGFNDVRITKGPYGTLIFSCVPRIIYSSTFLESNADDPYNINSLCRGSVLGTLGRFYDVSRGASCQRGELSLLSSTAIFNDGFA